ncbi:GEVED domain-containing protein [Wenyingzhuangia sp. IMCC45533]
MRFTKSFLFFILLITSSNLFSQSYCESFNLNHNQNFFISNLSLGDIDNSSTNPSNFTYYSGISANFAKGTIYRGSINYHVPASNSHQLKIWIDYNQNGDFTDSGEEIASFSGAQASSNYSQNFSFTVNNSALNGNTRLRVVLVRNGINPCTTSFDAGEVEDYLINIRPAPVAPTAICKNLNIELDVAGTANITANQINNGSFDDFDAANTLTYSIDKTDFTCNDLGNNTVTLTVTDLDGLSDTCDATVNVSSYSGSFTAPTLETINAYCEYTAAAPVLNYQCGSTITGTTTNPTTFNTDGTYTISWSFNNGSTIVSTDQIIHVNTPSTPTAQTISDIDETSANVSWNSSEIGPFKIRYKKNSESSWNVIQNVETTSATINGLSNNTIYDVQVAVSASCANFTSTQNFTTLALDYCTDLNANINNQFFLSNVNLGDITLTNSSSFPLYEYLNGNSTLVSQNGTLSGTVAYSRPNWPATSLVIWIDYNIDGDFDDDGEEVFRGLRPNGPTSITENVAIVIPNTASTGKTRMRIAMSHNSPSNSCEYGNEEGNIKDFDLIIRPDIAPPIAVCQNLNIQLDISGNATITAAQIDNGSSDDYDNSEDLILSLDKTTFDCNNLGNNLVTLTVTDTDGLTDTCTANVNVGTYTGNFTAPTLNTINAYCNYTATTPILNYQCGTIITATTSDITTFNTDGTYTIRWSFDNGETVVASSQTVIVSTPSTPSALSASDITETSVRVDWTSSEAGPFKMRYRQTGTSTWTEIDGINTTNTILTGLNNGVQYDIQVAVDADCATYTSTSNFTTIEVDYCDIGLNFTSNSNFYISNVTLGSIDNNTNSSSPTYNYFRGTSTSVEISSGLAGTVSYNRTISANTSLTIWIDYNIDGEFDELTEKVYSNLTSSGTTTVTDNISIAIPNTATVGKTRMRVAMSDNTPTNACTFNNEESSIQDFDLFIDPRDISTFETLMFTQVLHSGTDERWIEITNTSSAIIAASQIILALYKNTSGDQAGIAPDAEYTINTSIAANTSLIIRKNTSAIINHLGIPLENSAITDFDGGDDIIIITSNSGTNAWENRFDVISSISNETSYVRNDNISTYNNTYTSSEWTAFVDDNLDPYADGTPERHPNAPLLSEINNADNTANIKLGVHHFGTTSLSSNTWNNGLPDRSRNVIINDNYEHTTGNLLAKNLEVVSPNKLTISNVALIVSDELILSSGAEIRMVGSAQLIQTHVGTKQVRGTGDLYIDQNSNTDNTYRFNYFSSPVNSVASNGFTIADVMKDGSTPTSSSSIPKNINFVSGDDGDVSDPIRIAEKWIYTFAPNDTDVANFNLRQSRGFINQTDGFTFKGPGQIQNYTFVGVPKDGDLTSITSMGTNQNYLVGNPYPSAISAKRFIEDNEAVIDGTIYLWEHAGVASPGENGHAFSGYIGGYATLTKDMGLSADNVVENNTDPNNGTPFIGDGVYQTPQPYIAVAQGFFVSTTTNTGTITFNNSQREYVTESSGNSIFFKTKEPKYLSKTSGLQGSYDADKKSIIKIGVDYVNEEGLKLHRQLGLVLANDLTFGYEPGHDAISYNEGKTDIYWKFNHSDYNYIIAGVPQISQNLRVPLHIKTGSNGALVFDIDEWENVNREVYLLDKENSITYPLDNGVAKLALTPNTLYQDRFAITFAKEETLNNKLLNDNNLSIDYLNGILTISNPNLVKINSVKLFDLLGKEIKNWKVNKSKSIISIDTKHLTSGIHILKMNTEKGLINKKIYCN